MASNPDSPDQNALPMLHVAKQLDFSSLQSQFVHLESDFQVFYRFEIPESHFSATKLTLQVALSQGMASNPDSPDQNALPMLHVAKQLDFSSADRPPPQPRRAGQVHLVSYRLCQLPGFVPHAARFRRAPVQIKELKTAI